VSQLSSATDQLWYVSYGSNMFPPRLRYYLEGGRPPGGRRTYPGARDASPPAQTASVMLPGGVFFALESGAWTGGMAFYDPALAGPTPAAAYLLTRAQFSDLAVQEMYREPGHDLHLDEALTSGKAVLGPGRYETIVYVGDRGGHPMFTFTCPWHADEVDLNAPAAKYLAFIAAGIAATHGWDALRISSYLTQLPGVKESWNRDSVYSLVTEQLQLGESAELGPTAAPGYMPSPDPGTEPGVSSKTEEREEDKTLRRASTNTES
jgi:cation transport regulator ChaC